MIVPIQAWTATLRRFALSLRKIPVSLRRYSCAPRLYPRSIFGIRLAPFSRNRNYFFAFFAFCTIVLKFLTLNHGFKSKQQKLLFLFPALSQPLVHHANRPAGPTGKPIPVYGKLHCIHSSLKHTFTCAAYQMAKTSAGDTRSISRPGTQNAESDRRQKEKRRSKDRRSCWRYLSFQAVASQVLSTEMSLTTVFGMGTGGPSS